MRRWRCEECDTISKEDKLLTAPNPFAPDETIFGCPACKSVDAFTEICDVRGCSREATCGFPTQYAYRRTCYIHAKELDKP